MVAVSVVHAFQVVLPVGVLVQFVQHHQWPGGIDPVDFFVEVRIAHEQAAVLAFVPVYVKGVGEVGADLLGEGGLASLPGTGDEDHLAMGFQFVPDIEVARAFYTSYQI